MMDTFAFTFLLIRLQTSKENFLSTGRQLSRR